ncbi:GIY-YIG nuclease family protein [Kangiella koreensis]|uniref:Excinuclease ABC C subunit domain protein n=1 Tax=Kangiella koreensis (strain DSM 16069 / JCM 12317 / KCTC 12182 / SW-125) TaxID=523791 RepID=C7RCY7_KANKD|nr:GIY-YIG nuclease family protein [Kangiella koreensis]ACV27129.1 Excinuclease ABC C subunit domain protein [Kangiella koreensis DSM 16069]
MKEYYVYIMASTKNGVLYIGVTGNLLKRVYQHREGIVEGFSEQYKTKRLVYFESSTDITSCIEREKQLKNWKRQWKKELIEKTNPQWEDLWHKIAS